MKRARKYEKVQRIGISPSKMEVELVLETNHSAQHCQVLARIFPDRVVAKRIK